MPALTMAPTLGDLLKYELNGNYSRETVTLKSGANYALGSVLGKITASGKYRLSPAAQVVGDEGAETATAVLIEAVDATAGDKRGVIVEDEGGISHHRPDIRTLLVRDPRARLVPEDAPLFNEDELTPIGKSSTHER